MFDVLFEFVSVSLMMATCSPIVFLMALGCPAVLCDGTCNFLPAVNYTLGFCSKLCSYAFGNVSMYLFLMS